MLGKGRRGEHEVQLSGCRRWRLAKVVERGHAETVRRESLRPRVGLGAVGVLGTDKPEIEGLDAREHGVLSGSPVVVTVLAVAAEDVAK